MIITWKVVYKEGKNIYKNMGDQTKPMLKNKQPMFQACVCEPLEKVIEGKLIVVVVKMEKRE